MIAAVVIAITVVSLVRGMRSINAALGAKRSLLAAERDLREAKAEPARAHLLDAQQGFIRSHKELRAMGPVLSLARVIPLVRIQVRGMEAFADAGEMLARAGIPISDAASGLTDPKDSSVPVESALESLKSVRASLATGLDGLHRAMARVGSLNGYRLIGPLGRARRDLLTRLPRVQDQAESAERGLTAVIAFAGGSGPRRYLVLSQNPDEVRPTGGFIGTYGVLSSGSGKLGLERYDSIESWTRTHPEAVVPAEEAGSPFRFYNPPITQTMANINASPDWPTVARLAMRLWEKGGEQPVDGVLSITPGFLARALAVLGPVDVPGYNETVSANDVIERIDFHTHVEAPGADGNRKEFVAALAPLVMKKVLSAPASQWTSLARALADAFNGREAMLWSKDSEVATEVADRRWDSTLPDVFGDFFYGAEFEYAVKNGRGLKRTYDHRAELHDDGSAHITTNITIANTKAPDRLNQHALTYITAYGPRGATLDPASDPDEIPEATLVDHPATAWFRTAQPLETATLKVVWDVPAVIKVLDDGSLEYGLWWMGLPDHTGDILNLDVQPPPGWHWQGNPPPASVSLDTDLVDTWRMVRN